MVGYVKWHREFMNHPVIAKDSEHIAVWLYLLSNAAHTGYEVRFKGENIILKPGQLITGSTTIAQKMKIDLNKVKRVINSFESTGLINRQKTNKNSLITIIEWGKFQGGEPQNEPQSEAETRVIATGSSTGNIKSEPQSEPLKRQNEPQNAPQNDPQSEPQSEPQSKAETQAIATDSSVTYTESEPQSEPLNELQNEPLSEPKQECIKECNNKNVLLGASKRKRFTPPTIEEVTAYVKEKDLKIDPERFCDYYEANGWVQGKGKPIKDWKAAARNWSRNSFNRQSTKNNTTRANTFIDDWE